MGNIKKKDIEVLVNKNSNKHKEAISSVASNVAKAKINKLIDEAVKRMKSKIADALDTIPDLEEYSETLHLPKTILNALLLDILNQYELSRDDKKEAKRIYKEMF